MRLRFLCVTERRVPLRSSDQSASDVFPAPIGPLPTPSLAAGAKPRVAFAGAINPGLRSGLQRVTRAPGPFSARRRTIFRTGSDMELRVVSPCRHTGPASPASPCRVRRGRNEQDCATEEEAWKEFSGLFSYSVGQGIEMIGKKFSLEVVTEPPLLRFLTFSCCENRRWVR